MQIVILHDTESEEIVGYISPVKPVDFHKFYVEVKERWEEFNKVKELDYSVEDFVDYHNENSEMQIDYVINDFIQL